MAAHKKTHLASAPLASPSPLDSTSSVVSSDLLQPPLRETPAAPVVARPCCTQCGKSLRHLPLFLGNITCRECYGAERYQRGPGVPIGASSLTAPVRDNTYTA